MEVLILTIFVSLVLCGLAVLFFAWNVRVRHHEHLDRVVWLPLDEHGERLTRAGIPQEVPGEVGTGVDWHAKRQGGTRPMNGSRTEQLTYDDGITRWFLWASVIWGRCGNGRRRMGGTATGAAGVEHRTLSDVRAAATAAHQRRHLCVLWAT